AADNCPGVTVVAVPPSGSFFPIGLTAVKSIATDAAGNKDSCSFTVTVNDTQKPVASCPGNIAKDNDAGLCGAVVNFSVSATDQCPGATVAATPPSGSLFAIGPTQVKVIATDAAGLKDTCYFDVTIADNEKPKVTCPANIVTTVNLGDTAKIVEFTPTVTDNCPGVTYVATPASGSLFGLRVTTVNIVATDAHGLKDSCQFTVEVKVGLNQDFAIDVTPPDTIITTAGIPDSIIYSLNLTAIDGYSGSVNLSVSTLPTGVVLNFGMSPITVPNSTTLGGHTSVSTPAGAYELTITATEAATKAGPHSTKVWLIVNPCTETPIPVVSQQVFNVQVEAGQNLPNDSLFVTNGAPCGNLFWLASSDQDWVTPDPNQGSVNAGETPGSQLYLKYTTAALAPNTYVAHVTFVTDEKKTPPGAEVTINLTVTPKPPSADSIRVADANVYAGGTVGVPVYFNNNEPLGGMSVGLHWNSSDVTLDSVTHVGSRIDYVNFKFATINAADKTLLLGMATLPPEPFLMPGSGLWATMWFTAGSNCPVTVAIDSQYIAPGGEVLFVDSLAQVIYPQFAAGSIMVECAPTFCISGTITDTNHDPIVGATVELYSGYPPSGNPIATTTSGSGGYYEFCTDVKNSVFSVRAYKPGYYPDYAEATFPSTDLVLMLKPIAGTVTPTNEWVNLYCDLNALFNGTPVLPGSVIEAYDPQGVLCGQWIVSQAGTYGFMPVYRDDPYTPSVDEGCVPDDLITVKVDGYVATMANDPLYWGTNGDRYEACFDVTPVPPTHCLILKQGWNLVSWNIDTPNDNIMILAKDVMDNVDVILSFELGAQTYDPKLPEFSTLLYADHYHGFWFRMNAEDTLCVDGSMVAASTPIELEQNWNLVSYLPTVPFTVPVALDSIFDKVVVVLGYDQGALTYDPVYSQFNNLDEMKRDFGYWIKTTGSATLVYPGPTLAKTTPSIHKSDFTPRTSQSNTWVNLYGFNVKLNGETLPVGSVIEAYDASGALIGESVVRSAGRFGFMPVYGAETLSGDAVGKSAGSAITLKVDGEVAEQTVTWTGNGDRIRINELTTAGKNNGNLPTSFTLNQNYPNPFNPETAIDYVVGQSGHVELAIYNILGDKIKTLVSGYQAAG
ncbi:MAG: HYR domain-containing protein, partial [candidate division Zixibacteria bacterium]|nr:HYR domain-containing protein [candidate division Zixibacteria bacterium]